MGTKSSRRTAVDKKINGKVRYVADESKGLKPGSGAAGTFYVQNTEPVGVVAEAAAMLEERTDRRHSSRWMEEATAGQTPAARPSNEAEEDRLARRLLAEVSQDNADVNSLCGAYKLKREELGRLTGFSLRALAEWAGGKLPSQPAKRRLHEVRRLLDALAEIVKVESIPQWLHQPNPGFERLTPLQVIEVGEIDRLWAMVHDLGSGQPA
jgi:DNA-binding transcriptional regulator YiaG